VASSIWRTDQDAGTFIMSLDTPPPARARGARMISLAVWMRVAGALYLIMCIAAVMGTPIRAEGPAGAMDRAAAGDATARFLVNTWVTLGLLLGVLGAAMLYFSWMPERAYALAWTAVVIELAWGIPVDVFKILRGQKKGPSIVWIGIHLTLGIAGLMALGVLGSS
jgi:hypothetical protein